MSTMPTVGLNENIICGHCGRYVRGTRVATGRWIPEEHLRVAVGVQTQCPGTRTDLGHMPSDVK